MDGGMDVNHLTAKLLVQWDWRSEDQNGSIRRRSSSHESSPCSTCPSPEVQGDPSELFVDFSYHPRGRKAAQPKTARPKMSTKRRMKASEREKMRMRSLAEALHQLRDYLPPIYSRRGQPLTKIQTLKYTIEYIKELSDILNQE
ncbi:mesogenin-1 [Trichomycterus rosablanca]|uniref:mesogenin-1 n=1 Tax=Trichomycterus rosablanca TaxID=2290929 RepID=UPI002F35636D